MVRTRAGPVTLPLRRFRPAPSAWADASSYLCLADPPVQAPRPLRSGLIEEVPRTGLAREERPKRGSGHAMHGKRRRQGPPMWTLAPPPVLLPCRPSPRPILSLVRTVHWECRASSEEEIFNRWPTWETELFSSRSLH